MVNSTDIEVEVTGISSHMAEEEWRCEVQFRIHVNGQRDFDVSVTCTPDTNLYDHAVYEALGSLLKIGQGITGRAEVLKTTLRSMTPGVQSTS